jgi:hypothetical protein
MIKAIKMRYNKIDCSEYCMECGKLIEEGNDAIIAEVHVEVVTPKGYTYTDVFESDLYEFDGIEVTEDMARHAAKCEMDKKLIRL